VPLTENASGWIEKYIATARIELMNGVYHGKGKSRKKRIITNPTALFLSVNGKRLSYPQIWKVVKNHAEAAGLDATVHTFRHCCPTHLLGREPAAHSKTARSFIARNDRHLHAG